MLWVDEKKILPEKVHTSCAWNVDRKKQSGEIEKYDWINWKKMLICIETSATMQSQ